MNIENLKQVVRAAAEASKCERLIVLGPQAILPYYALMGDTDIDIRPNYVRLIPVSTDPAAANMINWHMGECSRFKTVNDLFAYGVPMQKATFPGGWRKRCLVEALDDDVSIECPHPCDILISEMLAEKESWMPFCRKIVSDGLVDWKACMELLDNGFPEQHYPSGKIRTLRLNVTALFAECADPLRSVDFAVTSLALEGLKVSGKAVNEANETILDQG